MFMLMENDGSSVLDEALGHEMSGTKKEMQKLSKSIGAKMVDL